MSDSATKVILVLGATGKQGGGVVKALSSNPAYTVLAVTRSPTSSKSQALLSSYPGTLLLKGDLDSPSDLFHDALALGQGPIYGVFAVAQSFDNASGGLIGEEKQSKALADEALKAGVKHFVYTSVDMGKDGKTEVPHFESKRRIEEYLHTSLPTLPTTILRPTFFMDNLGAEGLGSMQWKVMASSLVYNFSSPSKTIQMIACSDIGKFAALAFENPKEYLDKTVSLAGDEPTIPELQASYKSVMGADMPVTFGFLGSLLKWAIKDLGIMFKFFDETGYAADVPTLRQALPELKTWEQFLKEEVKPNVA